MPLQKRNLAQVREGIALAIERQEVKRQQEEAKPEALPLQDANYYKECIREMVGALEYFEAHPHHLWENIKATIHDGIALAQEQIERIREEEAELDSLLEGVNL